MKNQVAIIAYIYLFLLVAISASAQTQEEEQAVAQIRKWYYTSSAEIETYESIQLNDTLKAYTKDGLIRKVVSREEGEKYTREWFFTPLVDLAGHEKESYLYFMHEVNLQSREQHRFYFQKYSSGSIDEMVRWLMPDGSKQRLNTGKFAKKGVEVTARGGQVLAEVKKLIKLKKASQAVQAKVFDIDELLENRQVVTIEKEKVVKDTASVEYEDEGGHYVLPVERGYDADGQIVFVKTVSGIDGGHTVYEEFICWEFFDEEGNMIKKKLSSARVYLGYLKYGGHINNYRLEEVTETYFSTLKQELFSIKTQYQIIPE